MNFKMEGVSPSGDSVTFESDSMEECVAEALGLISVGGIAAITNARGRRIKKSDWREVCKTNRAPHNPEDD